MNIELFRTYCLLKSGVTEGFPFDETTLVLKVGGKMFALLSLDGEPSANLKCDPEKAADLREHYPAITPGYHMNKKQWNTVMLNAGLPDQLILELIDHSYTLVFDTLSGKVKAEMNNENPS